MSWLPDTTHTNVLLGPNTNSQSEMLHHLGHITSAHASPLVLYHAAHEAKVKVLRAIRSLVAGDDVRAELSRQSALTLVVNILGLICAFGAELLAVRLLGVTAYGHYSYAFAWISACGILAALGADTAVVRFVATYKSAKMWGPLKGVLTWSRTVALFASVLSISIGVALVASVEMSASLRETFYAAIGCILLVAELQVICAGLRALNNRAASRLPESVFRPIALGAALCGAYLLAGRELTGPHAALAQVVALAMVTIVAARMSRSQLPLASRHVRPVYYRRSWFAVGFPLLLVASTQMVMSRTDIITLGALTNSTEAGIYRVTSQLANLTGFGLAALVSVASPMLASLHAQGRHAELQRVLSLAAIAASVATIPIVFILVLGGPWLLSVFDQEFVTGYTPLLLLVCGQVVNVLAGATGSLLSMTGHQAVVARSLGVAAFTNVILNFALIPAYGAAGAAVATSSSIAIWNTILAFHCRKRLGFRTTLLDALWSSLCDYRLRR